MEKEIDGPSVALFFEYNGQWVQQGEQWIYRNGQNDYCKTPVDISYQQLMDMFYDILSVDRSTHTLKVELGAPYPRFRPVTLSCNRHVSEYLLLPMSERLPLCITPVLKSVSDAPSSCGDARIVNGSAKERGNVPPIQVDRDCLVHEAEDNVVGLRDDNEIFMRTHELQSSAPPPLPLPPPVCTQTTGPQCQGLLLIAQLEPNKSPERCASSTQGSGAKRVCESSLSSSKSKKVRGSMVECQLGSNRDTCNSDVPKNRSSTRDYAVMPRVSTTRLCFKIMLSDFADDAKRANLSKVISELGGIVTSDGRSSTHVIADKVIETLDFCTALCSGAWIVSESWLRESSRQGRFLNEKPYILIDKEYELKYKLKLKTAISRAKTCSAGFLKGHDVCFDRPETPAAQHLSIIVRSAGANIIESSFKDLPDKTIYVADEKCLEREVLLERPLMMLWLYPYYCSHDQLLRCVMRQRLNFDAPVA